MRFAKISELKKRPLERLEVFLFFTTFYLLADEAVKEGYFFKPSDVFAVGTHENLIIVLLIINLPIIYRTRLGGMRRLAGVIVRKLKKSKKN